MQRSSKNDETLLNRFSVQSLKPLWMCHAARHNVRIRDMSQKERCQKVVTRLV